MSSKSEARQELADLVDEQAKDEGLWFQTKTISEAYLQQELRRLHRAVETYLRLPYPPPPHFCADYAHVDRVCSLCGKKDIPIPF